MECGHWPLVVFTILVQTAVGTFLFTEGMDAFFSGSLGFITARSFRFRSRLTVLGLSIAAVAASVFHLGKPGNFVHSLSNLKASWLSREILLLGLFILAVALLASTGVRGWMKESVQRGFGLVCGILGILLIGTMSMIYMLPTVPVWNNPLTGLSFILTAGVLGSQVASLLAVRIFPGRPAGPTASGPQGAHAGAS